MKTPILIREAIGDFFNVHFVTLNVNVYRAHRVRKQGVGGTTNCMYNGTMANEINRKLVPEIVGILQSYTMYCE